MVDVSLRHVSVHTEPAFPIQPLGLLLAAALVEADVADEDRLVGQVACLDGDGFGWGLGMDA